MPLASAYVDRLASRLGPGRVQRDVPLAPFTTFRIGGPADYFVEAANADELATAVVTARELDLPLFLLGLGANILIGDLGFRGLVVRNLATHWTLGDDGQLWSETGTTIATLIRESARRGWGGLEHFVGIPSTVGGALWQNLHFLSPAPARERTVFIAEVFRSAELLRLDGSRHTVNRDEMRFGYDTSRLHDGREIALSTIFQLMRADPDDLQRVMQENLAWRGARHPWLDWYPSAGSIFQKVEGQGAGRLIDQAGLKGRRHGRAQISHLHANIIVNLGGATAREVRELIQIAQDAVQDQFGVTLPPEIRFIGEF